MPLVAVADSAADKRLAELMVKSGLQKQVGQYESMMQAGIDEAQAQSVKNKSAAALSPADLARLKAAVKKSFAPDQMRAETRQVIAAELPDIDQDAVLEWLNSALGRRITRLEESVNDPVTRVDPQKRMDDAKKLFDAAPPERQERLKRLSTSTRSGEAGANLMVNMTLGIAYGIAISLPGGDTSGVTDMSRKFQANRPQLVGMMEQLTSILHAHTYRTLSNQELDQYLAFIESPFGRSYHEVTTQAVAKAFTQASVRLGMAFGAAPRDGPQQKS